MKWITGAFLVFLAAYDMKTRTVPVFPVIGMGGLLLLVRLFGGVGVAELVLGWVPGMLFFFLALLSNEKIGKGDGLVLLALGCGFGLEQQIGMLGLALCLAAAVSAVLLVLKKATRKTELPFIPFLFFGFLIVMMID